MPRAVAVGSVDKEGRRARETRAVPGQHRRRKKEEGVSRISACDAYVIILSLVS